MEEGSRFAASGLDEVELRVAPISSTLEFIVAKIICQVLFVNCYINACDPNRLVDGKIIPQKPEDSSDVARVLRPYDDMIVFNCA